MVVLVVLLTGKPMYKWYNTAVTTVDILVELVLMITIHTAWALGAWLGIYDGSLSHDAVGVLFVYLGYMGVVLLVIAFLKLRAQNWMLLGEPETDAEGNTAAHGTDYFVPVCLGIDGLMIGLFAAVCAALWSYTAGLSVIMFAGMAGFFTFIFTRWRLQVEPSTSLGLVVGVLLCTGVEPSPSFWHRPLAPAVFTRSWYVRSGAEPASSCRKTTLSPCTSTSRWVCLGSSSWLGLPSGCRHGTGGTQLRPRHPNHAQADMTRRAS